MQVLLQQHKPNLLDPEWINRHDDMRLDLTQQLAEYEPVIEQEVGPAF